MAFRLLFFKFFFVNLLTTTLAQNSFNDLDFSQSSDFQLPQEGLTLALQDSNSPEDLLALDGGSSDAANLFGSGYDDDNLFADANPVTDSFSGVGDSSLGGGLDSFDYLADGSSSSPSCLSLSEDDGGGQQPLSKLRARAGRTCSSNGRSSSNGIGDFTNDDFGVLGNLIDDEKFNDEHSTSPDASPTKPNREELQCSPLFPNRLCCATFGERVQGLPANSPPRIIFAQADQCRLGM